MTFVCQTFFQLYHSLQKKFWWRNVNTEFITRFVKNMFNTLIQKKHIQKNTLVHSTKLSIMINLKCFCSFISELFKYVLAGRERQRQRQVDTNMNTVCTGVGGYVNIKGRTRMACRNGCICIQFLCVCKYMQNKASEFTLKIWNKCVYNIYEMLCGLNLLPL